MGGDPRTQADGRLIGLELLRFLAAVGVLVWHYQHFMFVGHHEAAYDVTRLPFRALLAPFYSYGYSGVQLFWCISGFILTWKYRASISRTRLSFGRFLVLRLSRLYPLQLATLLIVAALQTLYAARFGETFVYLFNDASHFVMNLSFANWWGWQSGESFNGPSWSVSAELLIYVAFFWITRRAGAGWRTDTMAMFGFAIAAPIAKTIFGIEPAFTGAGTFFFLGALTCHLHDWISTLDLAWRRRCALGCAGLIAVCAALVAIHGLAIAGASLAMFPAAILLAQLVVRPRRQRIRTLLTALGNLTYASYMLHFPMQLATMLLLNQFAIPAPPLIYHDWFMLAYLGGVFAAAFIVFRWVERPAQTMLRRIPHDRAAACLNARSR
ncbi:acyltransferase family protein [Rhodopila sp.]|uniref:acyltransferase family protein n=1 Tax=Rhodopila sp. TaxID=2480087 RepID=UPI003D0986C2